MIFKNINFTTMKYFLINNRFFQLIFLVVNEYKDHMIILKNNMCPTNFSYACHVLELAYYL
jgi:hypothetical protein